MSRAVTLGAAALTASVLLAGCTDDPLAVRSAPLTPAASPTASGSPDTSDAGGSGAVDPELQVAVNEPAADSVYPEIGDPGVDALHYDLALDWSPDSATLTAVETLTFRATATADSFRLDLSEQLQVGAASLDGTAVEVSQAGDDLVVEAPVEQGRQHVLELTYTGSPQPVPAPTTRSDFSTLGWTVTPDGEAWTMQEPYGAHTWYAVNDHPSDKALYDFSVRTDAPWVGVANGELVSQETEDRSTVSVWHLPEPAAPYLVTVAVGDFVHTEDTSASGVPIGYWTPRDEPHWLTRLQATPDALAWVEEKLGPYPYDTLGVVLVDSSSGMETQTMITLGTTSYATSPEVLVHEIVHHWYGDQVTPEDWSDLWMNEGMAMYLQWVFEAETSGRPLEAILEQYAAFDGELRAQHGPPGAYDPASFGESNVYFGGGLLWHEVRELVGEDAFWDAARGWPAAYDNGTADRDELVAWWEERTGASLGELVDTWLTSPTTPSRD